ncbi:cell division protein ZapA [Telmatobacter bradus]|uniref:cell division protein ZapA n=1 Tax=Telmatobacter bradus TaxID=474953 RepID=UPI003B42F8D5
MAEEQSGGKIDYVTVEIYDQSYHLSGQDPEHIRALAHTVDAKMRAVAAQGRTVDSLRVAVLTALNMADELARLTPQSAPSQQTPPEISQAQVRAASLRGLLDEVLESDRGMGV